jgi:hypothetical protein
MFYILWLCQCVGGKKLEVSIFGGHIDIWGQQFKSFMSFVTMLMCGGNNQ